MSQYIGYHIDGYNTDRSIPVSTGATYDEAMQKLMTSILGSCILDGYMQVQHRDDVAPEDFAKLTELTEAWAVKNGVA